MVIFTEKMGPLKQCCSQNIACVTAKQFRYCLKWPKHVVIMFTCLLVCEFACMSGRGCGEGVNCRNSEIIKILQQDAAEFDPAVMIMTIQQDEKRARFL